MIGERADPPPRTLRLTIEYDGTRYAGWQRQPGRITVQEVLEDAIARLVKEEVRTVAAGRTDAGVHAEGQVVSFRTAARLPIRAFVFGVNSALPEDVAVLAAEEVPAGFHAQKHAKGKHYRYRILNRRIRAPISDRYCARIPEPLDVEKMSEAADRLVGSRDFSAFRNSGSVSGSGVRHLRRLDIERLGDYISIDACGDGFLYKMVRNLVGTLVEVGRGKLTPREVAKILESGDRCRAGPTAQARGLCLVEVFY